jgi:hypothetical protein
MTDTSIIVIVTFGSIILTILGFMLMKFIRYYFDKINKKRFKRMVENNIRIFRSRARSRSITPEEEASSSDSDDPNDKQTIRQVEEV